MADNNMYPNLFHSDKWQVSFSNLPSIQSIRDMRIYDNFVKSITFPDYNMGEIYSDIMGFRIRHPLSKPNEELSQVQIEFKLSEDMLNYIYLFEWMRGMKYGDVEDFERKEDYFRKYTIKAITINILDNQKRDIAYWKMTECFLLSVGSLPLEMGTSEEVTFTCNFSYSEIFYEKINIEV